MVEQITIREIADTLRGFGLADITDAHADLPVCLDSSLGISPLDLVKFEVIQKTDSPNLGIIRLPDTNRYYVLWEDHGIIDSRGYTIPLQTYEDFKEDV